MKEKQHQQTGGFALHLAKTKKKKKNDGQPPHTIALSRLSQRLHKQISCTLPGVRLDSAAARYRGRFESRRGFLLAALSGLSSRVAQEC